MLTNQSTKRFFPQLQLRLNIPNIDQLLFFVPGDFVLLCGSHSVSYLTTLLCVRAQLPPQLGGLGSGVVFVDGANTFRLYQMSNLARLHGLNPRQVLDNLQIARAFTAYQMITLVQEKLHETLEKTKAKLVIISDIASSFLDEDIIDEEAYILYRNMLNYLSGFAQENDCVLIVTYRPHKDSRRNQCLQMLTRTKANVVASLKKTKYENRLVLEKHHSSVLGYAVLSERTANIVDFLNGSQPYV
jgi:hypothetical protein